MAPDPLPQAQPNPEEPLSKRPQSWRTHWKWVLAIVWLTGVGTLVLYLLLRPSPNASGIPLLPEGLVDWLNTYHDLRTLPMAWGYAGVPALILSKEDRNRYWCLGTAALVLIGGETAQIWIPTRFFTWPDIGYSVLGVMMAESSARITRAWLAYSGGPDSRVKTTPAARKH